MRTMATRIPSRQTRNEQVRDRITFWVNMLGHALAWAFILGVAAFVIFGFRVLGNIFGVPS